MRVLVVGMNPSTRSPKKSHATFRKLNGWMSECGVAYYSFCNTFDDISSAEKSKVDFNRLIELSCDYSKIIALGNFVSDALNTISVSHFKLPHPSPRNRLLNDREFEKFVVGQCKTYLIERIA